MKPTPEEEAIALLKTELQPWQLGIMRASMRGKPFRIPLSLRNNALRPHAINATQPHKSPQDNHRD